MDEAMETPTFLTPEEAAWLLETSEGSTRRWAKSGVLSSAPRVGRLIRIYFTSVLEKSGRTKEEALRILAVKRAEKAAQEQGKKRRRETTQALIGAHT